MVRTGNAKFALVLISVMYMYVGYAMPNVAGDKLGHLLDPKALKINGGRQRSLFQEKTIICIV